MFDLYNPTELCRYSCGMCTKSLQLREICKKYLFSAYISRYIFIQPPLFTHNHQLIDVHESFMAYSIHLTHISRSHATVNDDEWCWLIFIFTPIFFQQHSHHGKWERKKESNFIKMLSVMRGNTLFFLSFFLSYSAGIATAAAFDDDG